MNIIHVETSIQAVFGVLDDEGNVVGRHPVNLSVPKHSQENFTEALRVLVEARKELTEKLKEGNVADATAVTSPVVPQAETASVADAGVM